MGQWDLLPHRPSSPPYNLTGAHKMVIQKLREASRLSSSSQIHAAQATNRGRGCACLGALRVFVQPDIHTKSPRNCLCLIWRSPVLDHRWITGTTEGGSLSSHFLLPPCTKLCVFAWSTARGTRTSQGSPLTNIPNGTGVSTTHARLLSTCTCMCA